MSVHIFSVFFFSSIIRLTIQIEISLRSFDVDFTLPMNRFIDFIPCPFVTIKRNSFQV